MRLSMDYELETRRQLAMVYRLVAHYGWDDLVYTHISAKIPNTETFLINHYGYMFNEVTASNLVKVDLHGNVLGAGQINPAGYIIHSAIHEARPEVQCILHTHTPSGVAVSTDIEGLWPISQPALLVLDSLGYHDYQGLVLDPTEKIKLVENLGNNNYLMLRNHGLLTVGNTIPDCFLNMRKIQNACDIQVLSDYDRAVRIEQQVIDSNKPKVKFLNSRNDIPWAALTRLVEKLYPEYKE